jgi:hypothetical protein
MLDFEFKEGKKPVKMDFNDGEDGRGVCRPVSYRGHFFCQLHSLFGLHGRSRCVQQMGRLNDDVMRTPELR